VLVLLVVVELVDDADALETDDMPPAPPAPVPTPAPPSAVVVVVVDDNVGIPAEPPPLPTSDFSTAPEAPPQPTNKKKTAALMTSISRRKKT
jgi:hypothetical protein